jgi:aminopeptidase
VAFTPDPELLDRYADLIVRVGVNLQQGQPLIVQAQLADAELVRAIARRAWREGASSVDVLYGDPPLRRVQLDEGPDEALGVAPEWKIERLRAAVEAGAGAVVLAGAAHSALFHGIDGARMAKARERAVDEVWLDGVMNGHLAWTIVGSPTETWAKEAFGEPDVERLWKAVAQAARLDAEDPTAAWMARFEEIEARAAALSERRFDALRYRGPGTDLEVGLIPGQDWMGGRMTTRAENRHAPNIPTEECFTAPHRARVEGKVTSSLPLALNGAIVDKLTLRFAGGEIVEASAEAGEEVLRAELETDGGARRLGEVAIVDDSSGVAATGVTFLNTLFDENAASHIAFGSAVFPGEDAAAYNQSKTHVDFMVGCPELEIDGVEAGGATAPILREGRFVLDGRG